MDYHIGLAWTFLTITITITFGLLTELYFSSAITPLLTLSHLLPGYSNVVAYLLSYVTILQYHICSPSDKV